MLTKVLLICTQGFYKNESHRPRISKIDTEDEQFAPGNTLTKAEDWQDFRRIYYFIVMRSSTCFAMKDQITREFHLPLLHTNIYFKDKIVEDGTCIEDISGYKVEKSIL